MSIVDFFKQRRIDILGSQASLTAHTAFALDQNGTHELSLSAVKSCLANFPGTRRYYTNDQVFYSDSGDTFRAICRRGCAEIPSFGCARISPTPLDGPLVFSRCRDRRDRLKLTVDGHRVRTIKSYQIANDLFVLRYLPECFRKLFHRESKVSTVSSARSIQYLEESIKTLELIHVNEFVEDVTREILLFKNSNKNSFYDPRSHGAIFLRYNQLDDKFSYVEDIVHQCGHAQVSLFLMKTELTRNVPLGIPVKRLGFDQGDYRSLLVAFHGMATEALISDVMFRAFDVSHPSTSLQVLGRLAFSTRKLASDLFHFNSIIDVFDANARELIASCLMTYRNIMGEHRDRIAKVNLNGQSYSFSRTIFFAKNKQ